MPKVKISEYSSTANSNTDVASINIDEGCAPSGINNAIRAVMGHLKDFQTGAVGDAFNGPVNGALNGTVGATTPATGTFTTLSATGNVTLGDAAADTVTVNGTTNFVVAPTVGGVGQNGFKNRIINGAMVIDQRNAGASVTPINSQYLVDRWQASLTQASKYTAQQNAGSVTPPVGFVNYLGFTSSSSYSVTSGDIFGFGQIIEGFNASDLGWGTASAQTVTLSFWVRSSLTGAFGGAVKNNGDTRNYPFTFTISAANTWEQKTVTVAGDTSGTWLTSNNAGINIRFSLGCGSTYSGTAGAWTGTNIWQPTGSTSVVGTNGATFYITGVQLEKGSTATSFDYRPYGTELALCQRYYEVITSNSTVLGFPAYCANTTIARSAIQFKVTKRAAPTALMPTLASTNINSLPGNFNPTSTSFTTDTNSVGFDLTASSATFVGGQGCAVGITGTGITLNAEL